jgi:hypothetical protein
MAALSGARAPPRGPRRPVMPPWAPIGLVLIAIVVALFFIGGGFGKSKAHLPVGIHTGARHHRAATVAKRPAAAHKPAAPRTVKLQLTPTAAVYVCLVNGAGRKLIPGVIFQAGQTVPTETERKLKLTLGNASAQMKVNGSSVKIAPSASAIGYLIQPSGTTTLPTAQEPTCTS